MKLISTNYQQSKSESPTFGMARLLCAGKTRPSDFKTLENIAKKIGTEADILLLDSNLKNAELNNLPISAETSLSFFKSGDTNPSKSISTFTKSFQLKGKSIGEIIQEHAETLLNNINT